MSIKVAVFAKDNKAKEEKKISPEEKILELELLKEKLEKENYLINAYTGSLISTEKKCKINIYSSGKTIIKTKDSKLVEKLSKELSNILYPKELDA